MSSSTKLLRLIGLTIGLVVVVILALHSNSLAQELPSIAGEHVHNQGPNGDDSGFFGNFFKTYTPRRICMFYEQPVIWLHLISDILIALAYYSIPLALIYFVKRRKDLTFGWVFWMFALFILACGTTHIFGAIDLWFPFYRIEGVVKLITAILSVLTGIAIWPLIPKALAIPSSLQLEALILKRTAELELSNEALTKSERNAVSIVKDLEDSRKAESKSLAYLEAVVSGLSEGVITADESGHIIDFNPAALSIFGFNSKDEIKKHRSGFFKIFDQYTLDGKLISEDNWPLARLLRGETVNDMELILVKRDSGSTKVLSYSSRTVKDQLDHTVVNVVTIRDVTELRDNEQRFKQLANSIPQLAWMANPEGWVFWYNDRWHDYTGKTAKEMEGWGWQSVPDPSVLPDILERWKNSIATGVEFNMTFPLLGADGIYRPFLTLVRPLKDRDGNVTVWFGTNTDVSEEKKREEERQQLLEAEKRARLEAEKISNLKDDFLATLSHELRTPLNAIVGWSQLLKRPSQDQSKIEVGLKVIERNAHIQVKLIEDLLDMSRIISGNLRIDVQRINLTEVVNAAVESLLPAATVKDIRIEKIFDSHVGLVRGDPARVQQIIWNLLSNALKFTPKGGKIQVALERVNSHIEISVSDNGVGVHPEFLPHVFDRFRQADSSITRAHGGLGIGLAIVKNLVELHGGSVRAKSPGVGLGSTFSVELPLMILHDSVPSISSPPEIPLTEADSSDHICHDGLLKDVLILVVEDEPDARNLVREVLQSCHGRVLSASSAAEGFSLVKKERPDVILSDIGLPGEDGYSFIRRVRELTEAEGGTTPAAAFTAFARSEDRRRALLAGFQSHITKPVEPDELITLVASLAGKINKNKNS